MSTTWKFVRREDLRVWTATLNNGNMVKLMRLDGQEYCHLGFRNHETGLPRQISLSREAAVETAKKILSVYRVKREVGR